jgi:hypothetical protein
MKNKKYHTVRTLIEKQEIPTHIICDGRMNRMKTICTFKKGGDIILSNNKPLYS